MIRHINEQGYDVCYSPVESEERYCLNCGMQGHHVEDCPLNTASKQ